MAHRKKGLEYHPVVKTGTRIAIASLVLSSCGPLEQRVTPIQHTSTEPAQTETIPTPTPNEPMVAGSQASLQEIRAAFGGAIGVGGLIRIEQVYNTSTIQNSLNRVGLAPVLGEQEGGGRIISQYAVHTNGERTCFPNMPDVLFNPSISSGQDEWLQANDLIVSYGSWPDEVRFKGVGAVSLDRLGEDLICVNTVVNNENNSFKDSNNNAERPGKVLTVLLNRNNGEIYGTLPSIYSADEEVTFDFESGEVRVGIGTQNRLVWFTGEKMTELAVQITPTITSELTATPSYEQLQSLKPTGVAGEVVMGENGLPQLRMELDGYGEGDGLVYAEYKNNDWQLVSFSTIKSTENFIQTLESNKYSNYLYLLNSGISRDVMIYEQVTGQLVGIEFSSSEEHGQNMRWLILYKGDLFKLKPDFLIYQESGSDIIDEKVVRELNYRDISELLGMINAQVPLGNVQFRFDVYSFLENLDNLKLNNVCNIYGEVFRRACRDLSRDINRNVVTLEQLENLVDYYAYSPSVVELRNTNNLWKDTNRFSTISGDVITAGSVKIYK
jgi:hypothetical protein